MTTEMKEIRLDCTPRAIHVLDHHNVRWIFGFNPNNEYKLTAFVDDEYGSGSKWFLFGIPVGNFGICDLVRGDSFEEAYQNYLEFASKHRNLEIEDPTNEEMESGTWTDGGILVDTSEVTGHEVRLVQLDF